MRFLPALFGAERKDAATERAVRGPMNFGGGVAYKTNWSVERAVRDGLERVVWAYRSSDAISGAQSRLPMLVREGDPEEGKPVDTEEEPLLRLLNRRANAYETGRALRYRISTVLLFSKQGCFVEVVRAGSDYDDPENPILALHVLPPQNTAPIPGARRIDARTGEVMPMQFVDGYEVTVAGSEIQRLPANRVLWIKRPHPTDPYLSLTPTEAAGISLDMDFYARLYNRTFLQNDGRPGGILGVRGNLSIEDADELRSRFSGGAPGRTSVIEADQLDWVDTATTPRDAQYVEAMAEAKEATLVAYGTEFLLTHGANAAFDTMDAAMDAFWKITMVDHCDLISSSLDTLTRGGDSDDRYVGYDVGRVAVLQRDKRKLEEHMLNQFKAGLLTLNQYLEATGHDPLEHPGAKVFWLPIKDLVAIGEQADVDAIAEENAERMAAEMAATVPLGEDESNGREPGGLPGVSTPAAPALESVTTELQDELIEAADARKPERPRLRVVRRRAS